MRVNFGFIISPKAVISILAIIIDWGWVTFIGNFRREITLNYQLTKGIHRIATEKINVIFALMLWAAWTGIFLTSLSYIVNAITTFSELSLFEKNRKSLLEFMANLFSVVVISVPLCVCLANEYNISQKTGDTNLLYEPTTVLILVFGILSAIIHLLLLVVRGYDCSHFSRFAAFGWSGRVHPVTDTESQKQLESSIKLKDNSRINTKLPAIPEDARRKASGKRSNEPQVYSKIPDPLMAEAEYSEIGPLDEVNEVNLDESIQQHQRTTAIYDDVQDL